MDILDILMARALTPQGQISSYASLSQQAVIRANQAVSTVEGLLTDIETLTEETQANNEMAASAAEQITAALDNLQSTIQDIYDRIDGINTAATDFVQTITLTDESVTGAKKRKITVRKNNIDTTTDLVKNYTSTGQNEDGSMTQKAITDALSAIEGGGGNISGNITSDDNGYIVVVQDGQVAAGNITAESLIRTQILAGTYVPRNTRGIEIDYINRTISTIYNSTDSLEAITGRKRCTVVNDGTIVDFYGDPDYTEDGSRGQVMVYQPKFYYFRFPTSITNSIINKEIILVSSEPQAGFKLHPAFYDTNGNELDYCLLSAYEGTTYSVSNTAYNTTDAAGVDFAHDYLCSIAGVKPISGLNNNLTLTNAEQLAQNRGAGWHISTLKSESINQILALVEYNSFNIQESLAPGVTYIDNLANYNCASKTGSTASLGNESGVAASTENESAGTVTTYTAENKCAVSYHGVENPFGNIFKMLGDVLIKGTGADSGTIYICNNYAVSTTVTDNYTALQCPTSSTYGWITGFSYDPNYDWAFIPVVTNNNGNSSKPIGDYIYVTSHLNGTNMLLYGGHWGFKENSGLYFYGMDQNSTSIGRGYGARLYYQPTKNTIHTTNVAKWRATM